MSSESAKMSGAPTREDFAALIRRHLDDPTHSWAIGTFGAIGEFHRVADEPAERRSGEDEDVVVTERGAIRIFTEVAPTTMAYEGLSARRHRWTHGVAFCLPEVSAAIGGASVLTEVGPDDEAIRPENRGDILFDMGAGAAYVRACVRARDDDLLTVLRRAVGRSLMDPDNEAMRAVVAASPHRVFLSRLGRVEVYQGIPTANGKTPIGPHTHVLPQLLKSGRKYSATIPIPEGQLPCLSLFPSHPVTDGLGNDRAFDAAAHSAFQDLMVRYGTRECVAEKQRIRTAVLHGERPDGYRMPEERFARAASRVALRQLAQTNGGLAAIEDWRSQFDRTAERDDVDLEMAH